MWRGRLRNCMRAESETIAVNQVDSCASPLNWSMCLKRTGVRLELHPPHQLHFQYEISAPEERRSVTRESFVHFLLYVMDIAGGELWFAFEVCLRLCTLFPPAGQRGMSRSNRLPGVFSAAYEAMRLEIAL